MTSNPVRRWLVRHILARPLLAVLVPCVLAGCAVGPDYEKPAIAVPARWGENQKAAREKPAKLEKWWTRLRDPTLDRLVEEAVQGNLDVASARARIREARASLQQTEAALFPAVDGSGSATRSKSGGSSSSSSGSTGNLLTAGFDASWEVDIFGANRRAVEAAGYGVDAAEEDLRDTLVTLIGDIATNYVSARGYQTRADLARKTAKSQRETEALTRTKFAAGASSAVDVANATGQASSTEAAIPSLEASLAAAVHRLSVLTGKAPTALTATLKRPGPIPRPRLPIPRGVPADILTSRPDVRMAERQYAQYTARIGEAEAARYPSVSLTGSLATSGTRLGDLGRNSSISWSFGPSLSVPVFNAGRLAAAVEVAEAQRDQYFIAYRSAVLTALEDVENASVALAQEQIRYNRLAASAKAYRDAASLARALYQSGTSSFLDVLDAERSLYSAEDALIQSSVAITTDYVALNKALGGGWSGAIDSSKKEVVDTDTGPRLARAITRPPAGGTRSVR